ncbi:dual OB domain-containing protein [Massilia sp. UYP11]
MPETVLILASSRKPGGRCVAGKILGTNQWVRPVLLYYGPLYCIVRLIE